MKRFLNYIEIQTKITSLFPFVLTLAYLVFSKQNIQVLPTLVFFVGMFVFDLTTTAINNYIDSKTNNQDIGYSRQQGKMIIFVLLSIATLSGIYLVFLSDLVILFLGMMCFGIGILYTWGPVPISRQPYGEIISGVLYGFIIPFILVHVNAPGYLVTFNYTEGFVTLGAHLEHLLRFVVVFLPPTVLTSSIMLANNTCDLQADIEVDRFTLVYYIGQKNAVTLMASLYVTVYGAILISVLTGSMPWTILATLLTIPMVKTNFDAYRKDLIKRLSFKFIIKNFIIIMFVYDISALIGLLF